MGVEFFVERIRALRESLAIDVSMAFLRLMTSSSAWAGSRLAANSAANAAGI